MTRLLNVWWEGRLVGELTQDKGGDLGFRYATNWLSANDAPALSISLPKRVEMSKKTAKGLYSYNVSVVRDF